LIVLLVPVAGVADEPNWIACPEDEHGTYCALVEDEAGLIAKEQADADEHHLGGLCGAGVLASSRRVDEPLIEVEVVSNDGEAALLLAPGAMRMVVRGSKVVRRRPVTGGCALIDGKPATYRVGKASDGRQRILISRRVSVPLRIDVPGARSRSLEGTLHAFPPYDWPDTHARPAPLTFTKGVALAPDRVPAPPDDHSMGVWSVVSVRSGERVGARLVKPDERSVKVELERPAVIRLSVRQGGPAGAAVKVARYWFEDRFPGFPMTCAPGEGLTRWGETTLPVPTSTPVIEAPPGERRCLFIESVGTDTVAGDLAALRVPARSGRVERTIVINQEAE